jgi:hypothetical protein
MFENYPYNHTPHPPETGKVIPVIKEASSEVRFSQIYCMIHDLG